MSFPRIYGSFDEFQRDELRKLDTMGVSVDELFEERFSDELDFGDSPAPRRKRGRPRKTDL
jgi:hypothetical protein